MENAALNRKHWGRPPLDRRSGICASKRSAADYGSTIEAGTSLQESLILRCPAGASKDEAGAPTPNECKEQRWSVSFEAPAFGLHTSG
ncbi:hypothetical protein CO667_28325 [Rhizobium sp. L43]|nr:hypothetical protein CO667_28325 [Rhizobium sp. L43]